MRDTSLAAVDRSRLHAAVATSLEDEILSGARAVGERLPSEADLARTFGVSTRSVREALQVLEVKGLVRRKHGERAIVVRDDVERYLDSLGGTVRALFHSEPARLVEVMTVRRMFEAEAVGELAAGAGRLDTVERVLERMEDAATRADFPDYAEADAAFHKALIDALGNEVLTTLYQNLTVLVTDLIRLSVRVPSKPMERGLKEHRHIYETIRSGDRAAAVEAIRTHIDNSTQYILRALERRAAATEGPTR